MKRTLIKAAFLVIGFGLLMSGCATPQQQGAAAGDDVKALAEQAMAAAENANQRANNSLAVANEALDAARQAQSSSETALECCNENASKLDRAFSRAMAK